MDGTMVVSRVAFRDLLALTKPGLTRMVVLTAGMGLFLAPGETSFATILSAVLGTALVVGSANAFNSLMERESDQLMDRTRDRPLPAGRLEPEIALGFACLLAGLGFPLLWLGVGLLPTLLAGVAHLSYVLVYTPLKQVTPLATLVGAVPGAIPPVIGWSAATGEIGLEGLALFALLFVWQLPHFFAISLFRREEYGRAGIRVHPLVHGEQATRRQMRAYALLLLPISLLPVLLGLAGPAYGAVALGLGAIFLWEVGRGPRVAAPTLLRAGQSSSARALEDSRWARSVFRGSLVHLMALMILLLLDAGS